MLVFLRLLFFILLHVSANAHLVPIEQGELSIQKNYGLIKLSIPLSSLIQFDDNKDGHLGRDEFFLHQKEMSFEIQNRLKIKIDDKLVNFDYLHVAFISSDKSSKNENYRLLLLGNFKTPDKIKKYLSIYCDLFGSKSDDQSFSIIATNNTLQEAVAEVAVFNPFHKEIYLFKSIKELFCDYLFLGIEHILTGYDHLLFLLALLLGGFSFGYWLFVVSIFSIAHTITLAASVFSIVQISPSIVEPIIALSIMFMALLNIFKFSNQKNISIFFLVFIFGLLHGLGFSSAIDLSGIGFSRKIFSLVGFNIGVEIGQLIFIFFSLILFSLFRNLLTSKKISLFRNYILYIDFILGLFLFISRYFYFDFF